MNFIISDVGRLKLFPVPVAGKYLNGNLLFLGNWLKYISNIFVGKFEY
jgi:hypothetical protein